jgi:hypothetical protein
MKRLDVKLMKPTPGGDGDGDDEERRAKEFFAARFRRVGL